MQKERRKEQKAYAKVISVLAVIASIMTIGLLLSISGYVALRFFAGVLVLAVTGELIAHSNGFEGAYGLYMLGSKHGIRTVDRLASFNKKLWDLIADFGIATSFGIASIFAFKHIDKRAFAIGIVALVLIMYFVFPYLGIILDFMPQLSTGVASAQIAASTSHTAPLISAAEAYAIMFIAVLIGGFALFTVGILLFSGVEVIYKVFFAVSTSNYSSLSTQLPGVYPIIPGLTIPLAAGIISLAILLIVHEFSHGIQARLAKVKIKSIGIVLFGIIPFGAFVEPDEKMVKKLDKRKQNKIFIAGISANIIASLIFFVPMLVVLEYVLPSINTNGVTITATISNTPAYNTLSTGTTLLKWNNYTISNEYALAEAESNYASTHSNSSVILTTNKGIVRITPLSTGELGIIVKPASITNALLVSNFAFEIFALSFALNFFVAIFNLLPIPGFDGWRIYENKIKSKTTLNALLALTLIAILLNVVPWAWYL